MKLGHRVKVRLGPNHWELGRLVAVVPADNERQREEMAVIELYYPVTVADGVAWNLIAAYMTDVKGVSDGCSELATQ